MWFEIPDASFCRRLPVGVLQLGLKENNGPTHRGLRLFLNSCRPLKRTQFVPLLPPSTQVPGPSHPLRGWGQAIVRRTK